MIVLEPEDIVPMPMDDLSETPKELHARVETAYNTLKYLMDNGLPAVHITKEDKKAARSALKDHAAGKPVSPHLKTMTAGKALMLKSLLSEYDLDVVRSAVQMRNYIKLRLLELSSCGRESTELRALELLGKLADVSAFSETINVNINQRTTKEIEAELADKLEAYVTVDADEVESPFAGGEIIEDVVFPENADLNTPLTSIVDEL